jgi:hypothetical protein
MAHFAKVVNGIVKQVIVVEPDSDFWDNYIDNEPAEWVQTSFNTHGGVHFDPGTGAPDGGTPLRKNYAGIGHIYDKKRDAFYAPQPYPSWILDEDTCIWQPPYPKPDVEHKWRWDEDAYNADNTAGWVKQKRYEEYGE